MAASSALAEETPFDLPGRRCHGPIARSVDSTPQALPNGACGLESIQYSHPHPALRATFSLREKGI